MGFWWQYEPWRHEPGRVALPSSSDYDKGRPWPTLARECIRFEGEGHVFEVEVARDTDGHAVITGITLRRLRKLAAVDLDLLHHGPYFMLRQMKTDEPQYAEPPRDLSSRFLRRAQWARLFDIARTVGEAVLEQERAAKQTGEAQPYFPEDLPQRLRRVNAPRGAPGKGTSDGFYREVAEAYQAARAKGLSPIKEIARRKRAPETRVRQWVYQTRKRGYLPPVKKG